MGSPRAQPHVSVLVRVVHEQVAVIFAMFPVA